MERDEELQEEGSGVSGGVPQPRLQGGEAGQGLQEEVTRPHDHGGERWPKGEAECGSEGRHRMVASVWPEVEWHLPHDGSGH